MSDQPSGGRGEAGTWTRPRATPAALGSDFVDEPGCRTRGCGTESVGAASGSAPRSNPQAVGMSHRWGRSACADSVNARCMSKARKLVNATNKIRPTRTSATIRHGVSWPSDAVIWASPPNTISEYVIDLPPIARLGQTRPDPETARATPRTGPVRNRAVAAAPVSAGCRGECQGGAACCAGD